MRHFAIFLGVTALSAAPLAGAQDSGIHAFDTPPQMSIQGGLRLTVPLGAVRADRLEDRAKLQFGFSAARSNFNGDIGLRSTQKIDLLSFGYDETWSPRLSLNGADISTQAFPSLYADEDDETSGGSNALLYVAGGLAVLAVGTAVFVNEVENDLEDSLRCAVTTIAQAPDCPN